MKLERILDWLLFHLVGDDEEMERRNKICGEKIRRTVAASDAKMK